MADAVGNDAAKDARDRGTRKPGGVPQRLLGAAVPHGDDGGQARPEGRLEDAEEEAEGEEAGGVVRQGHEHKNGTPEQSFS